MDRISYLKKKRILKQEEEARSELIGRFQTLVLPEINELTGLDISVDDLITDRVDGFDFVLNQAIEKSSGLVRAYISKERCMQTLECIQEKIGFVDGYLIVEDYSSLGSIDVKGFDLRVLCGLVKRIDNRVLFYLDSKNGGLVIDYYETISTKEDTDYGVVIQGGELESQLSLCFS